MRTGPGNEETVSTPGAPEALPPLDPEAVLRDCDVEFLRASGPGGQHRNRRETGVRMTHRPTGLVVMATERRSQARNRELALERLMARLEVRRKPRRPRKPTRKGRGVRARELERKRLHAAKKSLRRPPRPD